MSREEDYARVSALAGLTSEGGILPDRAAGIDRSAKSWWRPLRPERANDPRELSGVVGNLQAPVDPAP